MGQGTAPAPVYFLPCLLSCTPPHQACLGGLVGIPEGNDLIVYLSASSANLLSSGVLQLSLYNPKVPL